MATIPAPRTCISRYAGCATAASRQTATGRLSIRRFGTPTVRADAATASNIAKAVSSAASPHDDHSPSWALIPSPIKVQASSVTTVGQTAAWLLGVARLAVGKVASLSPDI